VADKKMGEGKFHSSLVKGVATKWYCKGFFFQGGEATSLKLKRGNLKIVFKYVMRLFLSKFGKILVIRMWHLDNCLERMEEVFIVKRGAREKSWNLEWQLDNSIEGFERPRAWQNNCLERMEEEFSCKNDVIE
jgi:hypothetical protein